MNRRMFFKVKRFLFLNGSAILYNFLIPLQYATTDIPSSLGRGNIGHIYHQSGVCHKLTCKRMWNSHYWVHSYARGSPAPGLQNTHPGGHRHVPLGPYPTHPITPQTKSMVHILLVVSCLFLPAGGSNQQRGWVNSPHRLGELTTQVGWTHDTECLFYFVFLNPAVYHILTK